jgi:hypothetical protein
MKHEWDYVQGGKTSVKMHNAPGKFEPLKVILNVGG